MRFANEHAAICRAENCKRGIGIHPPHGADDGPILRDDATAGGVPPWARRDGDALMMSVYKAASTSRPTLFEAIYQTVVDDYGQVTERTVSRYLEKLVKTESVVYVDVDLPFRVYLPPKSKWLRDLEALREYVLTGRDVMPTHERGHDYAIRDLRSGAAIEPDEFADWLRHAEPEDEFYVTFDGHRMNAAALGKKRFSLTCLTCELTAKTSDVVKLILQHGRGM